MIANIFLPPRDGVVTTNVQSYAVSDLNAKVNYDESPVQTIFTYFDRQARLQFVGEGEENFQFIDRVERKMPNISNKPILDVRGRFAPEEVAVLTRDIELRGFKSRIVCPHDSSQQCDFAVHWSRELSSKNPDAILVGVRYGESQYALVDSNYLYDGESE
jgi:hypothetical protein